MRHFFLAVIGTLGTFQVLDPVLPVNDAPPSQDLIFFILKGLISILGGLLTALLSQWYNNYKENK